MIPAFDENGVLPPGIHPAALDEIELRFGSATEIRQAQFESIRWLMAELRMISGIQRVVLNGSFVTDLPEPNDVDCAVLVSDNFDWDSAIVESLAEGLPFLVPLFSDDDDFEFLVESLFASDRSAVSKGMIEVVP